MKKTILMMMFSVLMIATAIAQNVNDGIKQLYYQKYNTAKQTLQNAVNANPRDPNAIYWLGQSLIKLEDLAGAKALYQKALNEGVNDPMVWVGIGHIELLEGKRNEARQRFEAAITATLDRKKNPSAVVLTAIGRANADGPTNVGDPVYAVEKLAKAAELDKTNDPEIHYNMGINYLKMGSEKGGDAVQAFQMVLQKDPKNARALYRIGRVYETQNNLALFEKFYNDAIAVDPAFPATYLTLYDYYKNRDVNKALQYLTEFIKHAEQNPENEFFMADYLFRAGKYQESLTMGKQLESKYGFTVLPRLNVLYAYNHDRMGDSLQARNNMQKYLSTAKEEKVQPDDYVLAGRILAKFPGSEDEAAKYFEKALQYDTIKSNQQDYMNVAADIFGKAEKFEQQYQWLLRLANSKGTWGELEYYRLSDVSLKANNYKRVLDTLAPKYIAAFPDKPQGYYFEVRAAKLIDSTGVKGMAIEPINRQNQYMLTDVDKNKKSIYSNYYYLLVFYAEKGPTKDLQKAIEITEKMMALYSPGSEEHEFAKKTNDDLHKALNRGKSRTGGSASKSR